MNFIAMDAIANGLGRFVGSRPSWGSVALSYPLSARLRVTV